MEERKDKYNCSFEVLFLNLEEIRRGGKNMLTKRFSKYLMFIGEKIEIMTESSTILKGKCMGINNDGSLILEYNGVSKNIYNGSIIV